MQSIQGTNGDLQRPFVNVTFYENGGYYAGIKLYKLPIKLNVHLLTVNNLM